MPNPCIALVSNLLKMTGRLKAMPQRIELVDVLGGFVLPCILMFRSPIWLKKIHYGPINLILRMLRHLKIILLSR